MKAASIEETNCVDPNKDVECTYAEAYGVGDQKSKCIQQGKFAAESSKSQPKPISPFGDGDYPTYYEQKKKPSPEWAEFERNQWGK